MNTFSIKEKWNGPNCPKSNTPQLWPVEILLPNSMVFIPINTSTAIPHEKPNLKTCTLIPPQPPQKKTKKKKKERKKKKLSTYPLRCRTCVSWTGILDGSLIHKKQVKCVQCSLNTRLFFFNWKQTDKQKNYSSFSEKLADPSANRNFFWSV